MSRKGSYTCARQGLKFLRRRTRSHIDRIHRWGNRDCSRPLSYCPELEYLLWLRSQAVHNRRHRFFLKPPQRRPLTPVPCLAAGSSTSINPSENRISLPSSCGHFSIHTYANILRMIGPEVVRCAVVRNRLLRHLLQSHSQVGTSRRTRFKFASPIVVT